MVGQLFGKVSGTLYLGLMTNLLLAVACLPLLVLVVLTDPRDAWLLWSLAVIGAAPALHAAFAVFARHADEGESAVVKPFLRAWRAGFRHALPVAAAGTVATTILVVDIAWFVATDAGAATPLGAVAVPLLAVLAVLTAATSLGCLVGAADRPDLPLRRLARAAVYLMVRRWYLTALSAACGLVFVALLTANPSVAVGIAASPLLYIVWANTRRTMRPVLGPGPVRGAGVPGPESLVPSSSPLSQEHS